MPKACADIDDVRLAICDFGYAISGLMSRLMGHKEICANKQRICPERVSLGDRQGQRLQTETEMETETKTDTETCRHTCVFS